MKQYQLTNKSETFQKFLNLALAGMPDCHYKVTEEGINIWLHDDQHLIDLGSEFQTYLENI